MPSPPNFSGRLLSTFNAPKEFAPKELMASFNASPLSLVTKVTKGKKSRVATKIQALFRGHNTRRRVKAEKEKKQSRIRRALSKIDVPVLSIATLLTSNRTLRNNRRKK